MPASGVIETSGRGRAVPPCPICGGDDHVRRLIRQTVIEASPYWTCDDCIVAWVERSGSVIRSTAADNSSRQFR